MVEQIQKIETLFKRGPEELTLLGPNHRVVERYFISFSLICISLLLVFCLLNLVTRFYIAFWIDFFGIFFYLSGLFLYRKSLNINNACGILIFTCCMILFFQSIILETDAYHNMFFFPTVAVFCFALFNNQKYTIFFFALTCVSAIAAYFVPKYFQTTVWTLTTKEKDVFTMASVVASLAATYKIGDVLYLQKEESYQKLNAAHRELELLNQKNKKLLQLIIHDVSNPLQAISWAVSRAEKRLEENEHFIKLSKVCNPAILTIKEIIDLSREMMVLQDGMIKVELKEVDLIQVIEESEIILSEEISKKNLTIIKNIDQARSIRVQADPKSLRASVINNILSNAIKFSHRNSTIVFEVKESGDNLLLEIRDEGIGMPQHLMPKIFSAEETTSRYGTEGEKGTGYGLPLAKLFMTSYQGDITCESESEMGTCITLWFRKSLNRVNDQLP